MSRRGISFLLAVLLLSVMLFATACQPGNSIANLPERVAKKQAELTSYQITLQLKQADDQQLVINQWYQAPDCLRTDVSQDEVTNYQFFLRGDELTVRHVPSGQQEQLRLSSENALFTTPLLLELWREAQTANWRESEERPTSYFGEFSWRDLGGGPKLGSLWLSKKTLLPEEVSLFFGTTEVLQLRFESITLNPTLEEQIFQP